MSKKIVHVDILSSSTSEPCHTILSPQISGDSEFTIPMDSIVWKNMALGKIKPEEAISKKEVKISGAEPWAFYEFMSLFK